MDTGFRWDDKNRRRTFFRHPDRFSFAAQAKVNRPLTE
jgi:hypothetical protein